MITRLLRAGVLLAAGLAALLALGAHRHAGAAWPLALLIGLIAIPAAVATLIGVEFVVAIALGDRRWPGALAAWSSEVAASLRTFWFAIPVHGKRALRRQCGDRVPVVLVHGYFCNRAVWRPFARWLAARGHPFDAVDLEPPFASIDRYVPLIAASVDRMRATGTDARVVLVGHSMGGLAIRAYLRAHGDRGIAGVVTVGTPHRGTRIAALGLSESSRQMRRDSDWLAALAASESRVDPNRWTVVLSEHDNIVYPQSSQSVEGARVERQSGVGHLAMIYRPAVWIRIGQAIDRAAAQPDGGVAADARDRRPAG